MKIKTKRRLFRVTEHLARNWPVLFTRSGFVIEFFNRGLKSASTLTGFPWGQVALGQMRVTIGSGDSAGQQERVGDLLLGTGLFMDAVFSPGNEPLWIQVEEVLFNNGAELVASIEIPKWGKPEIVSCSGQFASEA